MDFANSAAAQFMVDPAVGVGSYNYQFGDFISGKYTDFKNNQAQTLANNAYEQQNLASARAWEEYLAKNKYQFAVEDLKKAGLNPWLAVQNGLSGSGITSNAGSGKSSAKSLSGSNDAGKKTVDIITSALKVLFLGAMLG